MLNKGINKGFFIIMMKESGIALQTKGVVYPFLTPMVPKRALFVCHGCTRGLSFGGMFLPAHGKPWFFCLYGGKEMKKYVVTAQLSATRAFDGGVLYIFSGYILRSIQLIIMLLLWRSLAGQGADLGGMSIQQLLLYTMLSSVFKEQFNIVSPIIDSFWDGTLISRYLRPAPVLRQLMAETAGSWAPGLLLYSLPMLMVSSVMGMDLLGALIRNGPLFLVSIGCSISLGFAMEFLFAAMVIHLKNANYTAFVIRQAIVTLLSGALIPFALMPWDLGRLLALLPFGSVASAPLLIIVGADNALYLLGLQILWNLSLWPVAVLAYKSSQERMVSFGG